ncbi:hypothetical protein IGI04_027116 [Brassica rapa subsp. trilocularis]|uniref:Uncharacterized protein n=1 Tax=Brassica rapa subsp. trilocularis TaxID=1813537 RepID=A0ABQ7L112_BRACM|nr:hypothetical protein IGI04_027116 [Brassica rapa subsp. trilocularis]
MSRHSTDESSLNRLFGHSLALITRRRSFSRHLTDESSLDRRIITRPTSPHSTDERSLAVSWLDLSRHRLSGLIQDIDQIVKPKSPTGTLELTHRTTRSCSDLFLTVTRLALLRSLDSHSCGHSTRTLAVTRLALLRSLDLLFAVTRLASLRSLDSLSQSLGSDRSLGVTQIARKSRA